ncbi:hypothetical protein LTS17_001969 [Exophiala oligosperma]
MKFLLSRLLGAWELVSYSAIRLDNAADIQNPLGKNCKGQIMYTDDGYMSVIIQSDDNNACKSDKVDGTKEDTADAASKTLCYNGPFYFNEKKSTLLHHAKIGLPLDWHDTIQVRAAEMREIEGHVYLTLGPVEPIEQNGVRRLVRLLWKKLPQNEPNSLSGGLDLSDKVFMGGKSQY